MKIKFNSTFQYLLLTLLLLGYFSTAQAQQECLDIEINEVVTITNDECSQLVSFQLNNTSPGSNVTNLIVFEFFRMENGVKTPIDESDYTIGHFFENLGFQKQGNSIASPSNTTFDVGTVMNETVADITVAVNQGECVDLLIEVLYKTIPDANGLGVFCFFEEMIKVCNNTTPDLVEVCGTLSDTEGCGVNPVLLGEISTSCFEATSSIIPISTGDFCAQVPEGGCITLSVKDCEAFCDDPIDARDLLALRKFILGIATADLVDLIIADVDRSKNVNVLDIVFIQRKILGFNTSVGNTGDCIIFEEDDHTRVNSRKYSGTPSAEICDGESPDLTVGVMGDFDKSCACDPTGMAPPDKTGLLPKETTTGTIIKPVNPIKFYDMGLVIKLDQVVQEREVIVSPSLPDAKVLIDGKNVKISFNTQENKLIYLESGTTLVEIDNKLANVQGLNGFFINSEPELSTIDLSQRGDRASTGQASPRNSIIENTTITTATYFDNDNLVFSNSHDLHQASIEVFNTAGARVFISNQKELLTGTHRFHVQNHTGILIVKITAKEGTFTNKLYKK